METERWMPAVAPQAGALPARAAATGPADPSAIPCAIGPPRPPLAPPVGRSVRARQMTAPSMQVREYPFLAVTD